MPWVAAPHTKLKGLDKDGKLAQEEWHAKKVKVNALGFCLVKEVHGEGSLLESLPIKETRSA